MGGRLLLAHARLAFAFVCNKTLNDYDLCERIGILAENIQRAEVERVANHITVHAREDVAYSQMRASTMRASSSSSSSSSNGSHESDGYYISDGYETD